MHNIFFTHSVTKYYSLQQFSGNMPDCSASDPGIESCSGQFVCGDVTDSKSESDGIRHFFFNPKSVGT